MMNRFYYVLSWICLLAYQSCVFSTDLSADIETDYNYLDSLFKHFHSNPELSFVEYKTSARLAEELRRAGAVVTEQVGGTGVVGILENGPGPTVLVRADMDALPLEEKSGLAYASRVTQTDIDGKKFPVMHACGHDVNMTSLVGFARQIQKRRDDWSGTLVLIGQPAEERLGGARKMIEDGLYERFPRPDYALALHVASLMEAGKLRLEPGITYSSSDSIDIIVPGVGAHGAAPQLGKDPVVIASQIVMALQTIVAREVSPFDPAVVTVGSFHSGTKHNIISDQAKLQLTVRSNDAEVRDKLLAAIKRIAENIGRVAGLPEDNLPLVTPPLASTPPTMNDPVLVKRLSGVFEQSFGEDVMVRRPRIGMGAEDFAYFLNVDPPVPGAYFSVGGTTREAFLEAQEKGERIAGHHSPLFKIHPKSSITRGVHAMTVAVLELMGGD